MCVDMGEPVLAAADVPTSLEATRDGTQAVAVPVDVAGSSWTVTAVGMGNPHAVVYSRDGADVVVRPWQALVCPLCTAAYIERRLSCAVLPPCGCALSALHWGWAFVRAALPRRDPAAYGVCRWTM